MINKINKILFFLYMKNYIKKRHSRLFRTKEGSLFDIDYLIENSVGMLFIGRRLVYELFRSAIFHLLKCDDIKTIINVQQLFICVYIV